MEQPIFIARLNIEHYRQKLLTEQEGAMRQQIVQLLAEEEAKLAALIEAASNSIPEPGARLLKVLTAKPQ